MHSVDALPGVPSPSSAASGQTAAADALEALSVTLGSRLAAAKRMLVSAESCTGGMIAAAVTDIAGSSGWFERGYVTYSNAAKHTAIGVPMTLIERHGAVSEAVAAAMAEGALASSLAQISVSVTGVAGPGGGSPEKPVGTVCFGWCLAGERAITETCHFTGDRAAIRLQTTFHAMHGLLNMLDTVMPSAEVVVPAHSTPSGAHDAAVSDAVVSEATVSEHKERP